MIARVCCNATCVDAAVVVVVGWHRLRQQQQLHCCNATATTCVVFVVVLCCCCCCCCLCWTFFNNKSRLNFVCFQFLVYFQWLVLSIIGYLHKENSRPILEENLFGLYMVCFLDWLEQLFIHTLRWFNFQDWGLNL